MYVRKLRTESRNICRQTENDKRGYTLKCKKEKIRGGSRADDHSII